MVERYIAMGYLEDDRLCEAMRRVPREFFMPKKYEERSYWDDAFPIPPFTGEQTISAPYTYPLFYEPLQLEVGESFLEIGAGSGYGAALAREMVGEAGEVVTIEIQPKTFRFAQRNLEKAGYEDVLIIQGDGSIGYEEKAPYDKICITATSPEFPPPLLEQLGTPGKMISPIGSPSSPFGGGQQLRLLERDAGGEERERGIAQVVYVPLKGEQGWGD